jgi:hypothetical protein
VVFYTGMRSKLAAVPSKARDTGAAVQGSERTVRRRTLGRSSRSCGTCAREAFGTQKRYCYQGWVAALLREHAASDVAVVALQAVKESDR